LTRLLIVGPPGSGKGTQAARIAATYAIPTISTGDIFRANIANKTELGLQVDAIVRSGEYVPDTLTNAIVADRLARPDAQDGFLLDGYPRTPDQLRFLDEFLAANGQALDGVIQLVADTEEIVGRLRRRAELEGRTDDTEATIRHRQELYARETTPLLIEFSTRGVLIEIDGVGPVDEVTSRIHTALTTRGLVAH